MEFLASYWWALFAIGLLFTGIAIFTHLKNIKNIASDFLSGESLLEPKNGISPIASLIARFGSVVIYMLIGAFFELLGAVGVIGALIDYFNHE